MRMNAFYVDVTEDGQWQRPSDLAPLICATEVQDAINDYHGAVDRFLNATLYGDSEIADVMTRVGDPPMQFPQLRPFSSTPWLEP